MRNLNHVWFYKKHHKIVLVLLQDFCLNSRIQFPFLYLWFCRWIRDLKFEPAYAKNWLVSYPKDKSNYHKVDQINWNSIHFIIIIINQIANYIWKIINLMSLNNFKVLHRREKHLWLTQSTGIGLVNPVSLVSQFLLLRSLSMLFNFPLFLPPNRQNR